LKKLIYIGFLALGLSACATSQAPLDDAYYWPDKRVESQEPRTESQEKMEIISQSDTTITVRIKR
jgi:hypothetical protein